MGDDANMENIVRGSTTHLKLLLGGLERTASEYEAVFSLLRRVAISSQLGHRATLLSA